VAARAAPPPGCAAMVIGRDTWRARGAMALYRAPGGFAVESVRPANFDRPWSPSRHANAALPAESPPAVPSRSPPRDATPQPEDVEADQ
jgi:hypothetical protein